MALVKEQNVVGIEVLEDNSIKVSTKVIVKDGDETVAGKSDYYVLPVLNTEGEPTDVSSEDARVVAVAGAVWTDEVIAAAQAAAAPAAEEAPAE